VNFARFEAALCAVGGRFAIREVDDSFTETPVILVAGDQASGKSTTAKELARHLGGAVGSTGNVVRRMAAERGLTFEAFQAELTNDPQADARNDLSAVQAIAAGKVVVFESRLAGHIGSWLRSRGRRGLLSVYIDCSPRERALRVLERATCPTTRARVATLTPPQEGDLELLLKSWADIDDAAVREVSTALRAAASRDRTDCDRIRKAYGLDYSERSDFDLTVDSSQATVAEIVEHVLTNA
jgi:cytidylate kinase